MELGEHKGEVDDEVADEDEGVKLAGEIGSVSPVMGDPVSAVLHEMLGIDADCAEKPI